MAGCFASCAIVPDTVPGLLRKAPRMLFDPRQPLFLKWRPARHRGRQGELSSELGVEPTEETQTLFRIIACRSMSAPVSLLARQQASLGLAGDHVRWVRKALAASDKRLVESLNCCSAQSASASRHPPRSKPRPNEVWREESAQIGKSVDLPFPAALANNPSAAVQNVYFRCFARPGVVIAIA
jgi:hypothetical protein